jgi:Fe-S cluster biogenesis protein NfuA
MLEAKVEKILQEKIRPIIKQDKGDIKIKEIKEDGTLVLVYMGRCSGCPAVEWTHSRLVQPAIMGALKEIKKIEWIFEYGY